MPRSIALLGDQLHLDGEPRILLSASLFPFRLPREQWAERIEGVRRLGYHCIDLIIPWNFHETSPGVFDFAGRRDVEHFLELVSAAGLMVLARPGPYICAEYDGGGYPAWLGTVEGMRLRQNDPAHLAAVERWFDVILPMLARHQLSHGGPVALVQLENELDFSACDDPTGYIEALKTMADRHGIVVPTITCAGEGDIARSNGGVADVAPAVNLYPDDASPFVEDTTGHYARLLRDRGLPLIVTESNRLHRTIRRMIVSGARFVGPYLQASSWNYDMSMSTNSWGEPYAFMSSDYDFGGVIAPDGSERADAAEGRILSRMLDALGARLAASTPDPDHRVGVPSEQVVARSLALAGGGRVSGVTNLLDAPAIVEVPHALGVDEVAVPAGRCVFVTTDLPLDDWGFPGTLALSTAEPVELREDDDAAVLEVHSDDAATVIVRSEHHLTASGSLRAAPVDGGVRLVGAVGDAEVATASGRVLRIRVISTAEAGRAESDAPPVARPVDVTTVRSAGVFRWADWPRGAAVDPAVPLHLEHHGIHRGSGVYEAHVGACTAIGVVVAQASDVVTVLVPGLAPRMAVNAGQDLLLPFPAPVAIGENTPLRIKAEVWGHSNFHDERLPALGLGSLRGIGGAGLVTAIEDLGHGWWISSPRGEGIVGTPPPYGTWAGWSSSARPQEISYDREIVRRDGELLALRIEGSEGVHPVEIDGVVAGSITPLSPVLDLTGHLTPGRPATMRVLATRAFDESFGTAQLLRGVAAREWTLTGIDVAELVDSAERDARQAATIELPVRVDPGEARWLHLDLASPALAELTARDVVMRFGGDGLRLTVVHHGHVISRIWSHEPGGVQVRGGRGDIALISRPWAAASPTASVLVEAAEDRPGVLRTITLSHDIDLEE